MEKIIGIDLGNTNSCVAVWQGDRVEVIADDQGNRITPSIVAFKGDKRLIGEEAKMQAAMNPRNTIIDANRFIEHMFDIRGPSNYHEWSIERDYPFKVKDMNGPRIQVEHQGNMRFLFPEEILSMVLSKMREIAEAHLDAPIKDAVITIPAAFNRIQHQAIRDAGTIAGLNFVRLINGSTAAAIAYGFDKRTGDTQRVLAVDLGGSALSVSLLTINKGTFKVEAIAGHNFLGGIDFDDLLVRHCSTLFWEKHRETLNDDPVALCRLRAACERAKRSLSSAFQATIRIRALYRNIDFEETIDRSVFEGLCFKELRYLLSPLERVLRDSKLEKEAIDEIILVGGSTRIPQVQQVISDFFDGRKLNTSMDRDEAVACGAAIYAASLSSGEDAEKTKDLHLIDAVPSTLSILDSEGLHIPLIHRNTELPARAQHYCSGDGTQSFYIDIYEGEYLDNKLNKKLGSFALYDHPPVPRDCPGILVTFDLDYDLALTVKITHERSGRSEQVILRSDRLSKNQIERMAIEAEEYKVKEKEVVARRPAKNTLQHYLCMLRDHMEYSRCIFELSSADKEKLYLAITDTARWLDDSQEASKEEIEKRQEELQTVVSSVLPMTWKPTHHKADGGSRLFPQFRE